jgi:nucleoside-diphosphate-sugar epimerase
MNSFHKDIQILILSYPKIYCEIEIDDTAAREAWGWNPKWDLDRMTEDMLKVIKEKHEKGLI